MWKYFVLLFLVLGIAFYYTYVSDPCESQIRTEFSSRHPSYEVLDSGAKEGSPESVRCRISYRKPGNEQTHEEIWLYLNSDTGWKFSRALEAPKREQTGSDR